MAEKLDNKLLALMTQAVNTKLGIAVWVSEPASFRQKFYATKQSLRARGINTLEHLICVRPPPREAQNTLWLIPQDPQELDNE
jgi:hypothetical protein